MRGVLIQRKQKNIREFVFQTATFHSRMSVTSRCVGIHVHVTVYTVPLTFVASSTSVDLTPPAASKYSTRNTTGCSALPSPSNTCVAQQKHLLSQTHIGRVHKVKIRRFFPMAPMEEGWSKWPDTPNTHQASECYINAPSGRCKFATWNGQNPTPGAFGWNLKWPDTCPRKSVSRHSLERHAKRLTRPVSS